MDATGERSIGEIIGWEFRTTGTTTRNGETVVTHGYWAPPDVDYSDGSTPNCDDMLAWLRQENDVEIHAFRVAVTPMIRVRVDEGSVRRSFDAPTASDALEAAVRAVDEASR
jgi:hypothetical protein